MYYMTIIELKQDFINYLGAMDKSRMNTVDLSVYANILKLVDDMMKPDRTIELFEMAKSFYPASNCTDYNMEVENG